MEKSNEIILEKYGRNTASIAADERIMIETRIMILRSALSNLRQEDTDQVKAINRLINDLEEKKEKLYKSIMLSGPIINLQARYPKYYVRYKNRFEEFYSSWESVIKNKSEIGQIKSRLFSHGAQKVYELIERDNMLRENIESIENIEVNYDKNDIVTRLYLLVVEKPIQDLFEMAELVLTSLKTESVSLQETIKGLEDDQKMLNREREIANNKIKDLTRKQRKLIDDAKRPSKAELIKLADETRKKNGTINFTAIAKQLMRANHTIKNWCNDYGIK